MTGSHVPELTTEKKSILRKDPKSLYCEEGRGLLILFKGTQSLRNEHQSRCEEVRTGIGEHKGGYLVQREFLRRRRLRGI